MLVLLGLSDCKPLALKSIIETAMSDRRQRLPLLKCSHVYNDLAKVAYAETLDQATGSQTTVKLHHDAVEHNAERFLLRKVVQGQLEDALNRADDKPLIVEHETETWVRMPVGTYPSRIMVVDCPMNCARVKYPVKVLKRLSSVCEHDQRHSLGSLRRKWLSVKIDVTVACKCIRD